MLSKVLDSRVPKWRLIPRDKSVVFSGLFSVNVGPYREATYYTESMIHNSDTNQGNQGLIHKAPRAFGLVFIVILTFSVSQPLKTFCFTL